MINAKTAFEMTVIEYLGVNKLEDLEDQIVGAISRSGLKPITSVTIESLCGELIGDNDVRILSKYLKEKGFRISTESNYKTFDYAYTICISW